jgi:hypothetical protein
MLNTQADEPPSHHAMALRCDPVSPSTRVADAVGDAVAVENMDTAFLEAFETTVDVVEAIFVEAALEAVENMDAAFLEAFETTVDAGPRAVAPAARHVDVTDEATLALPRPIPARGPERADPARSDAGPRTEEKDATSLPNPPQTPFTSSRPLVAFSSRSTRPSPCLVRNLNAILVRIGFYKTKPCLCFFLHSVTR